MVPSLKALHTAYVLGFLTTHELSDIEPVLGAEHIGIVDHDVNGVITLDPTTQTFTIQLANDRNISKWTHVNPGSKRSNFQISPHDWLGYWQIPTAVFKPLKNMPGTLFLAAKASIPSGENKFWIQQHRGEGDVVGRTVVEFYTNNLITAVVSEAFCP